MAIKTSTIHIVWAVIILFTLCCFSFDVYAQDASPTREELLEQSRNNPPPSEPQNLVVGTSHRMFNATFAREAGEIVGLARAAIEACDESTFYEQKRRLTIMERVFDSRSGGALPEAATLFAPGFIDYDEEDSTTIERVKSGLEAEWYAVQPCDKEPQEEAPKEPVVQQSNDSIMDETSRGLWFPGEPEPGSQPAPENGKDLEKKPPFKEEATIRKLRKKIEEIEKREKKINDLYGNKNAPTTLSKAFSKKGVGHSVQNAQAWGSSIWVTWQNAGSLYDTHKNKLHESIKVVQRQGGADKAELKILETGFRNWQKAEKKINLKLKEITSLYADLGLIVDERQGLTNQSKEQKCGYGGERGSCDALKEKSAAIKEKMDDHNDIIKAKKKDLQNYSEQIHFDVIGQGELVAEQESETCPTDVYSCEWENTLREDIPDFLAMADEMQQHEQEKMNSCSVGSKQ